MRCFCQILHRQLGGEIAFGVGQRALDTIRFRLQFQQRRKLRLATGAAVIDHELFGHGAGDVSAKILLDQRQCEVDARGCTRRGPYRTIGDEDAVFLHLHVWKLRLQIARVIPMRGRAPTVEQAGFGQDERTGTGCCDPPVSPQRLPHEFDQARCRRLDLGPAADDQRVEIGIAERLCQHAHAHRGGDRPTRLGQQLHLVDRLAEMDVGEFKCGDDGETHHLKAGKHDETDALHDGVP